MTAALLTKKSWPDSRLLWRSTVGSAGAGFPKLLVKEDGWGRWHQPAVLEVDEDADLRHIALVDLRTRCGEDVRVGRLLSADYSPELCQRCWPPLAVQPGEALGHLLERAELELPRGRFGVSVIDVGEGVRTTYRGRLSLDLRRFSKPTSDVHRDFSALARHAVIDAVETELHGPGIALDRRMKIAMSRTSQEIAIRLAIAGRGNKQPSRQEVREILGWASKSRSERRDADRYELLQAVARVYNANPIQGERTKLICQDAEVLRLLRNGKLSEEYARQLVRKAAAAGLIPPLTPRGRNGGRRKGTA